MEAGVQFTPPNELLKKLMQTFQLATPSPSQDPKSHQCPPCLFAPSHHSSEIEDSGQDPRDISTAPQFQERGRQQGRAVMRWKIWANPEPNEGLIRAVKICQLLVNSSSGPELGGRGRPLLAGAFGPVPRVLFFSPFLVFFDFGM